MTKENSSKKTLSLREVAEAIGVHPDTARKLVRGGILPPVPGLGKYRVSRLKLEEFIAGDAR